MSDIALRSATTLINVAWSTLIASDMRPPNSPNLNPVDYAVWGLYSRWSINVDNSRQSTSWCRQSSLNGANCRSVWLIPPLVSSVADTGLSASSSSKADILNIWCENCDMWQLLWTLTEKINKLFFVVHFLQNLQISHCFQLLLLRH